MANRIRADFLTGVCNITAGNPATLTTTTNVNVSIPCGYYLPIILNPPPFGGSVVNSEIVYTEGAYSSGSTSFTVSRAEEGSGSLGAQTNIPWISGPTVQDFGILNGMLNGDFPIPTASGQYLAATASGIGTVAWHVGTGAATVSGSQIVGWIPGALISGTLSGPNVTLAGSDISGNIPASQLTGSISTATLPGSNITGNIPASQVTGALGSATIPSSNVTGTIPTSQIVGVFSNSIFKSPIEQSWINATAPNGTMNIYVVTNGTSVLCTTAATANFTFNVAATFSTTLNSLLSVGQEITIAVKVTQGGTAYYCTAIDVDGSVQTVNWQGGVAPSAGNASGIDVYSINITKTASATYTVLAGLIKF